LKVLVTGGGGFIGSHLVERLLAEGHDVRVIDNFATGRRTNIAPLLDDLELVEADVGNLEAAHDAVRGCEVVFHQAALPSVPRSVQDPIGSNHANVIGTLNVLIAARDAGVRRVVYASSSSVYGRNPALPKREDLLPQPLSPYAVSKLAGEGYCSSFSEIYGLETVSLRYFNVFGPRQDPTSQYSAAIPKFVTAFLEAREPTVFGDGEQSRDFTYIDNVVEANLLAAGSEGGVGEAVNIACGERITVNRLVADLQTLIGSGISPIYGEQRPGEVVHSLADIGRAGEVLGYRPIVGFKEGLDRTVRSFQGDPGG
jgi:nucleoside-diphosphate-sugar epimerase